MVFADALYDAVIDGSKVLPILFLAYLLVSFLSHDHSHKFSRFLSKNKKTSVLYASFLGCVPQCGFSSVIADLYSKRMVSLGTLVAVFVATSDEAIPIMVTNKNNIVDLLILIGVKVLLAIFWGYIIDLCVSIVSKMRKKAIVAREIKDEVGHHDHEHEHNEHEHCEEGCEREHNSDEHGEHDLLNHHHCGHVHSDDCGANCGHSHGACCVNNVFLDAFMHTFEILIYIFVATFAINLIVGYCGMDVLQNMLTTNPYAQIFIASLIGLIPNCASSVLLVELFVYGSLGFPALLAGLTAGAGVGVFVLIGKNRKHMLENVGIIGLQYLIGVVSGLVVSLFYL